MSIKKEINKNSEPKLLNVVYYAQKLTNKNPP